MIPLEEKDMAEFRKARILSLAMLVAAPLIYLLVASFLDREMLAGRGVSNMVVYILLIVALAQGGLIKVIERFQTQIYRRNPQAAMAPAQFFVTLSIIRLAIIESVFLFGLIVFLLTGSFVDMLWFYIIGAVWAAVYWPRRDNFDRFVKELQTP